ncbi:MAG: CYTH domain-containing protein [Sneathiella sp.]|nr:CYTH domain-containing protein [Sneathiella sp.]
MEIERKFLTANDSWKDQVQSSFHVLQFYLTGLDQSPTIRLRLAGGKGYLTLKYPSISKKILAREEFEYEIPAGDIEAQIDQATGAIIRKTRHQVKGPDGRLWEVDEFKSPLDGLIVAEIELSRKEEKFDKPSWLGEEVTNNPAYSNLSLSFSTPLQQ